MNLHASVFLKVLFNPREQKQPFIVISLSDQQTIQFGIRPNNLLNSRAIEQGNRIVTRELQCPPAQTS